MSRYITVLALILVLGASACAESLWQPESAKSQYADKRASKVGDIVTVLIVETATSSQSASTNAKKDSSLSTDGGTGTLLKNIPAISYSGGDSVKASGNTTRTSTFTTTMTATITKILDNGNFQIEGSRFVQTNAEKEEVKLSGVIRQQDITTDNTVSSTCIADAKITHVGSGAISSRQREGIISKIFKILF
ncbi:flagellar basal body L-ring protein FlgH [bacterium]|nr:flagellar basal body L-ring protein FlgH [bacterium]